MTYHIITIGCQMNIADSERIGAYLENYGLTLNNNRRKADILILTTCGVRQAAEDRIYGLVPKIKKENPKIKIILTGCLANRNDVKQRLKDGVDFWLPIIELPTLAKKLNLKTIIEPRQGLIKDYLDLKTKYSSTYTAFIPIGNGCNNFCAYCVVPYARGRETYRTAKSIIKEAEKLIKQGYKEITLIAQNVNSYQSGDFNFAKLLKTIDNLDGNFWLRFSTSHPKDMSDELIKVMSEGRHICHHLHLPVQAGDNKILMAMNRKYTIEHYKNLIKKIREKIPDISLTTDIIVGFPGETKAQFKNSEKLFKDIKYDMAYIAGYSPRPGTVAAKLKDNVSLQEKKSREYSLNEILKKTALTNNKKYLKQTIEILIDEEKNNFYFGKTKTFRKVRVKKNKNINLGDFVKIKITSVKTFGLEGELIKIKDS